MLRVWMNKGNCKVLWCFEYSFMNSVHIIITNNSINNWFYQLLLCYNLYDWSVAEKGVFVLPSLGEWRDPTSGREI